MEFTEIKSSEEAFIAGYGDGGFRMGDNRFEGSMLITANGFYPWDVSALEDISVESLKPILDAPSVEILIVGMGENMAFLSKNIRAAFQAKNIAIEAMDTGAAARTYNVLLQEGRKVTAALIAI
ncbi:MAG: Mth938-like domain-containing protein [Emcibacteraceae bacterium]|nr:Mth938-like domain-containing protein [Emcibacteraceae bacterium]MDG1859255.1 Mth938-like domain-containing protein [Emcibacteraceae bacterium]